MFVTRHIIRKFPRLASAKELQISECTRLRVLRALDCSAVAGSAECELCAWSKELYTFKIRHPKFKINPELTGF